MNPLEIFNYFLYGIFLSLGIMSILKPFSDKTVEHYTTGNFIKKQTIGRYIKLSNKIQKNIGESVKYTNTLKGSLSFSWGFFKLILYFLAINILMDSVVAVFKNGSTDLEPEDYIDLTKGFFYLVGSGLCAFLKWAYYFYLESKRIKAMMKLRKIGKVIVGVSSNFIKFITYCITALLWLAFMGTFLNFSEFTEYAYPFAEYGTYFFLILIFIMVLASLFARPSSITMEDLTSAEISKLHLDSSDNFPDSPTINYNQKNFCPKCGTHNALNSRYCPSCGNQLIN